MKKHFLLLLLSFLIACSGKEEKISEENQQAEISRRDSLFQYVLSNKVRFKEIPLIGSESDADGNYMFVSAYLDNNKLKLFHQQYSEDSLFLEDYYILDDSINLVFVNTYGFDPISKQRKFERKIYLKTDNPEPIRDIVVGYQADLQEITEYYNNFYEFIEVLESKTSNGTEN